jgi:sterol desaturase/sphingolipid hydroxylase (fatty acid hydroxylase superfamily)
VVGGTGENGGPPRKGDRRLALGPYLVTTRYHHFHHATEAEAIDKNFAVHLPVLDRLSGTQFLPGSRGPRAYGVSDGPVARTYLARIPDPFRM